MPPPLNNQILGDYDKAFALLPTNTTVRIFVRPTMPPFVWMHPDPQPTPGLPLGPPKGRHPLAYLMGHWEILFVAATPGQGVWLPLRAVADFYDTDFNLRFATPEGSEFLRPDLGENDQLNVLLEAWAIGGCALPPMPRPSSSACATNLTTKLNSLFEEPLTNILVQILEDYPAPQFWNAKGDAEGFDVRQVIQTDSYKGNQYIFLYGEL